MAKYIVELLVQSNFDDSFAKCILLPHVFITNDKDRLNSYIKKRYYANLLQELLDENGVETSDDDYQEERDRWLNAISHKLDKVESTITLR